MSKVVGEVITEANRKVQLLHVPRAESKLQFHLSPEEIGLCIVRTASDPERKTAAVEEAVGIVVECLAHVIQTTILSLMRFAPRLHEGVMMSLPDKIRGDDHVLLANLDNGGGSMLLQERSKPCRRTPEGSRIPEAGKKGRILVIYGTSCLC